MELTLLIYCGTLKSVDELVMLVANIIKMIALPYFTNEYLIRNIIADIMIWKHLITSERYGNKTFVGREEHKESYGSAFEEVTEEDLEYTERLWRKEVLSPFFNSSPSTAMELEYFLTFLVATFATYCIKWSVNRGGAKVPSTPNILCCRWQWIMYEKTHILPWDVFFERYTKMVVSTIVTALLVLTAFLKKCQPTMKIKSTSFTKYICLNVYFVFVFLTRWTLGWWREVRLAIGGNVEIYFNTSTKWSSC